MFSYPMVGSFRSLNFMDGKQTDQVYLSCYKQVWKSTLREKTRMSTLLQQARRLSVTEKVCTFRDTSRISVSMQLILTAPTVLCAAALSEKPVSPSHHMTLGSLSTNPETSWLTVIAPALEVFEAPASTSQHCEYKTNENSDSKMSFRLRKDFRNVHTMFWRRPTLLDSGSSGTEQECNILKYCSRRYLHWLKFREHKQTQEFAVHDWLED
ncbi:uncharacterized protein LOC144927517 isoform X2 [Branchiostoma floridae x Branchiostoma belcheri]